MLPGTLMDKEQDSVRMAFRWIIFVGRNRTVWPEEEEVSLVHRFPLKTFLYNIFLIYLRESTFYRGTVHVTSDVS